MAEVNALIARGRVLERDGLTTGELTTDEAKPRPIVRPVDLVEKYIELGHPWREAALEVSSRIEGNCWADAWLLRPGLRAIPLPDDLELCRGYPSGIELRERNEARIEAFDLDASQSLPPIPLEEARIRGVLHQGWEVKGRKHGMVFYREDWEAMPEIPRMVGRAGVAAYLRHVFTTQAQSRAELSEGHAGRIGMLEADALRLFPGLFRSAPPQPVLRAARAPAAAGWSQAPDAGNPANLLPAARDDTGRSVRLKRAVDLVSEMQREALMSDRDALAELASHMEGPGAWPAYLLRRGDYAEPLTDERILVPGRPGQKAGVRLSHRRSGFSATDWGQEPVLRYEAIKERSSVMERRGAAGAAAMLRELPSIDALNNWNHPLHRLAFRVADVVVQTMPSSDESEPPAVHPPAHSHAGSPIAVMPAPAPQEWTGKRMAIRMAELKAQTPKLAAPMETLLAEMGLEANDANKRKVQREISKTRPPADLQNVWNRRTVRRK